MKIVSITDYLPEEGPVPLLSVVPVQHRWEEKWVIVAFSGLCFAKIIIYNFTVAVSIHSCSSTLSCAFLVYSNLVFSCHCCSYVCPPLPPFLSTSVHWYCLGIAGPLAPPPPSMQITPQLPLMGFVARVQETSKWLLAPRSPCMTTIRFESSPQQLVSVLDPFWWNISLWSKRVINLQHSWSDHQVFRLKTHSKSLQTVISMITFI